MPARTVAQGGRVAGLSSAQPQLVQAAICSDSLRPPSEKRCRLPKPPPTVQERVRDLTDGRVWYTAPLRDRVVPPSRPYSPLRRAGLGQQVGDGRQEIQRKGMSYSEMMQIPSPCVSASTSLGESASPAMPI